VSRLSGDRGQVGGIEAIPFGLLVFVVGGLLIANAWAVVDAKFATDAAAREAARTFVESRDPATAEAEAEAAARATVTAHGRDGEWADVRALDRAAFARCERVTFEVAYEVPALNLPLVGGWGPSPFTVRSRHSEVVDPYRGGVPGEVDRCA
jgi:hypothetical protein